MTSKGPFRNSEGAFFRDQFNSRIMNKEYPIYIGRLFLLLNCCLAIGKRLHKTLKICF